MIPKYKCQLVIGHWSLCDFKCCIDHCTLTNDHRPFDIYIWGRTTTRIFLQ
jgi:hypothetical protein